MEAPWSAFGHGGIVAEQSRAGGKAVLALNVFLDSSALAKRYVQEPGSDRLDEILSSAASLGVSIICISDVVSALCRRRRERKLSRQQYLMAKQALFEDIEDASVINVTDQVMARAVELLERWPLRSSDAVHVASAAEWSAELFVSADERQCAAARRYGLQVEELSVG
jgi:predicted nucleic acid-binding protein